MSKISDIIKRINPCEASEDSLVWSILSTIFPHYCWCCSAIRGFVYGVGVTGLVWIASELIWR